MAIEIRLKKVIERGDPKFLVANVKALINDELPASYLNGVPKLCFDGYRDLEIWSKNANAFGPAQFKLKMGIVYDPEYINHIMEICRESGKRLKEINKKINELEKTWNGEKFFSI